jgi:predicted dehydrogenase
MRRRDAFLMVPAAAMSGSAANDTLSVGLIGAGGRGTHDASLLQKHTNARITAVSDIDPNRIAAARKTLALGDAPAYENFHDLLNNKNIDAVLIATPVFLHPEHLEAAIAAGKHIYIEKPAGADAEGARRVLRASDRADRKINITFGFQQRYGPGYRKAHQLVTSGALGRLHFAHSHWIKGTASVLAGDAAPWPKPANDQERVKHWKRWKATFGDYIVETYCHGVDVLNWFLGGHPESAFATGIQAVDRRSDMRDHCTATFTYKANLQATLTGSQVAPIFHREVNERFYGPKGVIETAREYWKHQVSKDAPAEHREPQDITIDALSEFVKRVREGKPENTGVAAAESTLTAIMARDSMDRGREVTWKEVAG